ncbi:hypothetical protein [Pseudomonas sp. UMAB-40]|uniref:hypothetical protein n=1 Tax=Pseudomonas sp. UMAB-40 TaxID=1365407 RepID=UPI001C5741E0|nr:hypothetical protein [Pseudomonas sp. UMAB-40]
MNDIKTIKILHVSETNEEDVTLLIDGHTVECFINSCPHKIEIGKIYQAELTLNLPDSYQIAKTPNNTALIEKKAKGYAYFLCGTLKNEIFESFTDFHDEDIHYEHPELNDTFLKLEVDRIDVNFL